MEVKFGMVESTSAPNFTTIGATFYPCVAINLKIIPTIGLIGACAARMLSVITYFTFLQYSAHPE